MTPRHLRAVEPVSSHVDIYASWLAEIESRDWSACHVNGDKAQGLALSDRPRRWWRK